MFNLIVLKIILNILEFFPQKNLDNEGGFQTVTFPKGTKAVTWVKMTVESLHNLKNPKQFGVRTVRLFGRSAEKPGE